ncbi:hypothetical protein HDU93_007484 [Gonapodya sp. JEL0774]|nr:hypothetical protein HDU93_007484 [Gonapodya sp. JEL0774]
MASENNLDLKKNDSTPPRLAVGANRHQSHASAHSGSERPFPNISAERRPSIVAAFAFGGDTSVLVDANLNVAESEKTNGNVVSRGPSSFSDKSAQSQSALKVEHQNSAENDDTRYSSEEALVLGKDVEEQNKEDGELPVSGIADYPEGGYGWVVIFACFLLMFSGLGLLYSWGVYLSTYVALDIFPGSTYFSLSWVGSMTQGVNTAAAPFMGQLSDRLGSRLICIFGTILLALSFIGASFSTEVWHLFLTQGFIALYFGLIGMPAQWFLKKRGIAMGLAVSGGGLGGMAWGPITQVLVDAMGFRWALRVTGIIAGVLLLAASLFLRSRFPPPPRSPFFNVSYFRDRRFVLLYVAFFFFQFGFMVPFAYIPSYAKSVGLTSGQGSFILGLTNGASAVGRIVLGLSADNLGHLNAFTLCELIAPLSALLIWPFCKSFGTLSAFAVVFGFFSGGFISLMPTTIASVFGSEGLGSRMGMQFTSSLFGALAGGPIAGALVDAYTTVSSGGTNSMNFVPMIMFAGGTMLAGAILIAYMRMVEAGWKLIKRV